MQAFQGLFTPSPAAARRSGAVDPLITLLILAVSRKGEVVNLRCLARGFRITPNGVLDHAVFLQRRGETETEIAGLVARSRWFQVEMNCNVVLDIHATVEVN